jgi:hypothetical protein
MSERNRFLVLSTIAVSLGWGLRGTIGGSSVGAMIPGTILGLCIGWHYRLTGLRLATFAAWTSLGVGLGGQETYGQTIGLLRSWDTAAWGMLGLTIKGAVWALGAAIVMWIDADDECRTRPICGWGAILLLTVFTVVGWQVVNVPKHIYFSDPMNKPREEVWFGQALGPIVAACWVALFSKNRGEMVRFLAKGTLAGAVGFGGGSLWLLMGLHLPAPWHKGPWWKMMEFSFGACLGLGFALASRHLPFRSKSDPVPVLRSNSAVSIVAAALLLLFAFQANFMWSMRMNFTWIVPVLLLAICLMPVLAWHVALSFTIAGFIYDILEGLQSANRLALRKEYMPILIVIIVLGVSLVTRFAGSKPLRLLLFLTLAASGTYLVQTQLFAREGIVVPLIFAIETLAVVVLCLLPEGTHSTELQSAD